MERLVRRRLCGRIWRFPDSALFSRDRRGRLSRFRAVATVLPTGTLKSRGSWMAPVKPFSGGCRAIRQSAINSRETTGLYSRYTPFAVISRDRHGSPRTATPCLSGNPAYGSLKHRNPTHSSCHTRHAVKYDSRIPSIRSHLPHTPRTSFHSSHPASSPLLPPLTPSTLLTLRIPRSAPAHSAHLSHPLFLTSPPSSPASLIPHVLPSTPHPHCTPPARFPRTFSRFASSRAG